MNYEGERKSLTRRLSSFFNINRASSISDGGQDISPISPDTQEAILKQTPRCPVRNHDKVSSEPPRSSSVKHQSRRSSLLHYLPKLHIPSPFRSKGSRSSSNKSATPTTSTSYVTASADPMSAQGNSAGSNEGYLGDVSAATSNSTMGYFGDWNLPCSTRLDSAFAKDMWDKDDMSPLASREKILPLKEEIAESKHAGVKVGVLPSPTSILDDKKQWISGLEGRFLSTSTELEEVEENGLAGYEDEESDDEEMSLACAKQPSYPTGMRHLRSFLEQRFDPRASRSEQQRHASASGTFGWMLPYSDPDPDPDPDPEAVSPTSTSPRSQPPPVPMRPFPEQSLLLPHELTEDTSPQQQHYARGGWRMLESIDEDAPLSFEPMPVTPLVDQRIIRTHSHEVEDDTYLRSEQEDEVSSVYDGSSADAVLEEDMHHPHSPAASNHSRRNSKFRESFDDEDVETANILSLQTSSPSPSPPKSTPPSRIPVGHRCRISPGDNPASPSKSPKEGMVNHKRSRAMSEVELEALLRDCRMVRAAGLEKLSPRQEKSEREVGLDDMIDGMEGRIERAASVGADDDDGLDEVDISAKVSPTVQLWRTRTSSLEWKGRVRVE